VQHLDAGEVDDVLGGEVRGGSDPGGRERNVARMALAASISALIDL